MAEYYNILLREKKRGLKEKECLDAEIYFIHNKVLIFSLAIHLRHKSTAV